MQGKRLHGDAMRRVILSIAATLINVGLAYCTRIWRIPLYLDCIGTITISALGGIFPGITVAVATNLLCAVFNPNALYFTFVHVLLAIYAAWFFKNRHYLRSLAVFHFVMNCTLISGILSGLIQWALLGKPQSEIVEDTILLIQESTGWSGLGLFLGINLLINLLDKGIAVFVALLVFHLIPESIRKSIMNSGWRQKPLSEEELIKLQKWGGDVRRPIRKRITWMMTGTSLALVLIMGQIGMALYYYSAKTERLNHARMATRFASEIINPYKVGQYLSQGWSAPDYESTRNMLKRILDNSPYVDFLYVIQVRDDGCYYVFDVETEGSPAHEPGDREVFDDDYLPYVPSLLAGEEIEPIESVHRTDWFLRVYTPVKDQDGITRCYVGADVSMSYMAGYMRRFLLQVFLILAGFFVLILACGMWITGFFMVYPINSMAEAMDGFVAAGEDQSKLDASVRSMRSLGIATGDEIEKMYHSLCQMAASTSEQLREIRRYSDATTKMQNGLIITMADMVENRDSDTGAHIQKTAAYVRIILEGLKRKGYYAEKLTPKYMLDVEMSAPLHDVGKINISDAILNKPGKLTEEEFEIMKTHTTAGKQIMEKAISTVRGENYLKEARNMAAYHHERWDGKGYPEGLHGEVIPLSARIMAVADVFDALTSARIYKPPFTVEKALEIIQEGSGTQFDPKCVEVFMDSLTEVRLVLMKYQDQ